MEVIVTTVPCTRCKKINPEPPYKLCPKCRKLMRGQYYRLRREKEMARHDWMDKIKKELPCTDCGEYFPYEPYQLTWDHLPGFEKIGNISDMVAAGLVEEVLEEIKKCELVCAKCHGLRGVARGQIKKNPPKAKRYRLTIHHWRPRKSIGRPRKHPKYGPAPVWQRGKTIYNADGSIAVIYDQNGFPV